VTEARQALVLHLVGGGEPVWITMSGQKAGELSARLSDLVTAGGIQVIETADGRQAVVNFAHVAFAMITTPPPLASSYGSLVR
jgi:hypothetical protein